VKELLDEQNVFQDLGVKISSKVIDDTCTRKHWMLYGSKKYNPNPNALEAYKITKIFNRNCERLSLKDALKKVLKVARNYDESLLDTNGDRVNGNVTIWDIINFHKNDITNIGGRNFSEWV
jgi:hypothetical protein